MNQPRMRSLSERLLLTVAEAAALLGVARSTLYEEVMRHRVRSVRIGRARRIPGYALEEYIRLLVEEEEAS